jgi:hypothetical protein
LIAKILVVTASAVLETVTGVALIATPAFVIRLLFGVQLSGGGVAVGRVCGIGLLALGFSSLPSRSIATRRAITALFFYNLLSSFYFCYLGSSGQFAGILLWPACFVHGLLAVLLVVPAYQELRRRAV